MNDYEDIKYNANALMVQGHFADAIPLLVKLYESNSADDDSLLRLGVCELKIGNVDSAQDWLKKACELKPNNPASYIYLANIQMQNQQAEDAIESYRAAIALQPDLVIAHLHLASLLMNMKLLEDAEYHYKYVIKLQPTNADAYANLAQVQELLNKIDDAKKSVSRALSIVPGHVAALMALGKLEKREKKYSDGAKTFEKVISLSPLPSLTALAFLELGHCFDKLGRYDDAITATEKGKDLVLKSINNLPFDKKLYQSKIEINKNFLKNTTVKHTNVKTIDRNRRPAPIFFVGFPRSGTTLVEQILNQHNDIVTSDEIPLIDDLIKDIPKITSISMPYPQCLDSFSVDDYSLLREQYWKIASNLIEDLNEQKILVDKLPLNIVELGFISRLFPDARVLVALRDPRDVCLSCFMQAFTPNPAMINFVDMESTTLFYNQVMELWLQYRDTLSIDWFQYKYEDLVENFDNTTRDIFAFLKLDYPEDAEFYYKSVKHKAVNTPSYQDVATPIYTRSKERWRNYEKQLSRYVSNLESFIDVFGYTKY